MTRAEDYERLVEASKLPEPKPVSDLHIVELLRDFGEHARANPLCRVMDRAELVIEGADLLDQLYQVLAQLDQLRDDWNCADDELGALCGNNVAAFILRYRAALRAARAAQVKA